jgi:hypothetical protein
MMGRKLPLRLVVTAVEWLLIRVIRVILRWRFRPAIGQWPNRPRELAQAKTAQVVRSLNKATKVPPRRLRAPWPSGFV